MKSFASLMAVLTVFSCYASTLREVAAKAMEGYRLFTRDSLPSDRADGYAMMLDAAWEGDAKAANNIGWLKERGEFVEKDMPGALRWYERAADQGLPAAALNYVSIVFNHPEALEEHPADIDRIAHAAMLAGTALAMGRGLHYDYRQGEDLIMRAAVLGDDQAALTVAQQLEMYPDSFSSLPLSSLLSECLALLRLNRPLSACADNRQSLLDNYPSTTDVLLDPSYWYSRINKAPQ